MCHIYLCTEHLLPFRILSVTHFAEQLEVLLNAAVSVWALGTRNLHCTTACADLLLGLIVYIGEAFLYEFLSPLVKLVEIVRSITLVLPVEAEPLDVLLGLGRPPGEGKGYPLQYSGLENSMDCIVYGVAKSQTRPSNLHFSTTQESFFHSPSFLQGSQVLHLSSHMSKVMFLSQIDI